MGNNPPVGVLNFTCNVPRSFASAVLMDTHAMDAIASWCTNINRNWPETVTVDPLNLGPFMVSGSGPPSIPKDYTGSIRLLPSLDGKYSGTLPPSCAHFSTWGRNFGATNCHYAFQGSGADV